MSIFNLKTTSPDLPNPAALSQSVLAVRRLDTKIAELREEERNLTKTIADFIGQSEESDANEMQRIAGLKVRVEMIPQLIKRREAEQELAVAELYAEGDRFQRELKAHVDQEREALLDKVEALLKPYAPDIKEHGAVKNAARNIAGTCQMIAYLGWNTVPSETGVNMLAGRMENALERGEALLALARSVSDFGSWLARSQKAAAA